MIVVVSFIRSTVLTVIKTRSAANGFNHCFRLNSDFPFARPISMSNNFCLPKGVLGPRYRGDFSREIECIKDKAITGHLL